MIHPLVASYHEAGKDHSEREASPARYVENRGPHEDKYVHAWLQDGLNMNRCYVDSKSWNIALLKSYLCQYLVIIVVTGATMTNYIVQIYYRLFSWTFTKNLPMLSNSPKKKNHFRPYSTMASIFLHVLVQCTVLHTPAIQLKLNRCEVSEYESLNPIRFRLVFTHSDPALGRHNVHLKACAHATPEEFKNVQIP